MAFLKSLNRLMLSSGVKDFSLRDLYKPEAQRLRRNLSAIINFAKFREEKLIAYTELQEQFEALVNQKDAAEAEHVALQAELAALKASRAAELPEVARIEAETQAVYAENQSLNKQQSALNTDVRALKQQANALTDEASQLRYKLSQARSTGEDLRSQVVHSPQKIQSLLEEIATAVDRERAALADAERRSRDLASRLDLIGKVEREVSKALGLMEEAETEIARKKEVSRKVKALRAEVAASEHEATQLAATHQHLKRQQAALMDRIDRVKTQCEVKRQAAEGRVEEQLRNKEAIEAQNAAAVAKLTENEAMVGGGAIKDAYHFTLLTDRIILAVFLPLFGALYFLQIRTLRERIAELRAAHEAQVGAVLSQYHHLRESVAQYHEDMEAAMAEAVTGRVFMSAGMRPVDVR